MQTIFSLPTYPTKKYRVGVQQTDFFKDGLISTNLADLWIAFSEPYSDALKKNRLPQNYSRLEYLPSSAVGAQRETELFAGDTSE